MNARDLDRARRIVEDMEARGYSLQIDGDAIVVKPRNLPADLEPDIRAHRDDVFEFLRVRSRKPDSLEGLRKFLPDLLRLVQTSDGKVGLLWGVYPSVVCVSLPPYGCVVRYSPSEVRIIEGGTDE